jgi:hypothetical protein
MASTGGRDGSVEGMVKKEVSNATESEAPAMDPEAASDSDPYDSDEHNYSIWFSDSESDDESEANNTAISSESGNHNEGNAVANTSEGPAAKRRPIGAPSAEEVARPEPKLQPKHIAVAILKEEKGNIMLNAIVIIKNIFWRADGWICNAQFCVTQGSYSTRAVGTDNATLTLSEEHFRRISVGGGGFVKDLVTMGGGVFHNRRYDRLDAFRLIADVPGKVEVRPEFKDWRDEEDFKAIRSTWDPETCTCMFSSAPDQIKLTFAVTVEDDDSDWCIAHRI